MSGTKKMVRVGLWAGMLAVVALAAAGGGYWYARRANSAIEPFTGVEEPVSFDPGTRVLVMGSGLQFGIDADSPAAQHLARCVQTSSGEFPCIVQYSCDARGKCTIEDRTDVEEMKGTWLRDAKAPVPVPQEQEAP